MTSYSQNKEDLIVLEYFKGKKGRLLDIGANDGLTLSNSRLLIQLGWEAVLVEPSPKAYERLVKLYPHHLENVMLLNNGIAKVGGKKVLYESGAHLSDKSDIALLSSTEIQEQWRHLEYSSVEADFWDFQTFDRFMDFTQFDFISIDAEGSDWDILQQINLKEVGCKCLVIEYNSKPILHGLYTNYVKKFGFKEIAINAENVIYAI